MIETTQNNYSLTNSDKFFGFLATVSRVYTDESLLKERRLEPEADSIPIYNGNKNFGENDVRFLGAIEFLTESTVKLDYAYPLDKNSITYPIIGETVIILVINSTKYWLPFSSTLYPNYRENYSISALTKEKESKISTSKPKNYKESKETGIPNQTPSKQKSETSNYEVKEKIHFLKPKIGDTIITGRNGQSIRFSEFFLTEDGKSTSPSIFIRNLQSEKLNNEKIGTLVEENINEDGSSIYIVSKKVKVPFKETVKKEKIAFKDYPTSDKLKGNQIFINSDRVFISSKAEELILFGAKNTGIITDGRFSVDAKTGIYMHSENNDIVLHTINGKNIFLNSDSSGKIYLGKNKGEGDAGASVQKMVLGGELVKVLEDLIDAITKQMYLTPAGPSATGPTNVASFNQIKSKLKTILSAKNFLSKN